MVNIIKCRVLTVIFVLVSVCIVEGKTFLPSVLKMQIKNLLSTSNYTNNKLWMKYLEKRLMIVNQQGNRGIFSCLEFLKSNSQRKLFKNIDNDCRGNTGTISKEIQKNIYGKIVGLPKSGKEVPEWDYCETLRTLDFHRSTIC